MAEAERPLAKSKTLMFRLRTADGRTEDLLPTLPDSNLPVLTRRFDAPGPALVTMRRDFSYITLSDSAFRGYLKHESLTHVEIQRALKGPRPQERERYARNLKALVQVGTAGQGSTLHSQRVGQELEIVLLQNPYTLQPGSTLTAQLLYQGKPLATHPLFALHKAPDGKFTELIQLTNAEGKAAFTLPATGVWVVRTVHLFTCKGCPTTGPTAADWESQWAAFTFELPEKALY